MSKNILRTIGVITIGLGLTAAAHAEQLCSFDDDTNAFTVQADSGQGNYDCEVLELGGTDTLTDLYGDVVPTAGCIESSFGIRICASSKPGLIDWQAIPQSIASGVAQIYPAYFVSTNSSGQGKRCNYLYDGQSLGGEGLGATSGTVNSVTVCGDTSGTTHVLIPPADIKTNADSCAASWDYDEVQGVDQHLSIGISAGVGAEGELQDLITVCAAYSGDDQVSGSSIGQIQCEPAPYQLKEPTGFCSPAADGSLSLSCAPVDIYAAPGDFEYCWYYENRVCEADSTSTTIPPAIATDAPRYCEGRAGGTYIPKTKKGSYNISIDVIDGSTCYTYFLYGRAYYHCF